MKASDLRIGGEYVIRHSEKFAHLVGKRAKVLSNIVVPDGLPNQRTVLVEVDGNVIHMLPRLLDDGTVVVRTNTGAVAPSVVMPPPPPPMSIPASNAAVVVERRPITDPMDPRLDTYRPDARIVKEYVSRTIGTLKDTELLLHFWRDRDSYGYSQNVMLVGDTQAGKTMLVQVLACLIAKEMGYPKPLPVFTLSGSAGVTDFDMLGQPTAYTGADGVERLVWLPGLVDLAARVPSILYLDEVNMMPERVTSTLHPVCDDRRTFVNRAKAVELGGEFLPEQVKVCTGTWIVGTYNAGYRGAGNLNEAFQNRFRHIPWDYDDAVEKKIISSPTVLLLGKALRDARDLRAITTPVGTKALQRLQDDIKSLGVETALWIFTGMFNQQERPKIKSIITDRSIEALLMGEQDDPAAAAAAAGSITITEEQF